MRVTLLGVLAVIGVLALLVYLGDQWQRTSQGRGVPPPQNPDSSMGQ